MVDIIDFKTRQAITSELTEDSEPCIYECQCGCTDFRLNDDGTIWCWECSSIFGEWFDSDECEDEG
jgi:hypothetical protein